MMSPIIPAANAIRGEVSLIIDAQPRCLCLTLGALAQMESGLGAANLTDLQTRLRTLSAQDLLIVLAALLRGGGETETANRLAEAKIDIGAAAQAIEACFKAAHS